MHIRPLLRSDISKVAALSISVAAEDPFVSILFPDAEVPAFYAFLLHRYRGLFCTPGFQGFVCVSDRSDGGIDASGAKENITTAQEILGFALWLRHGSPEGSPTVRAWTQRQETLNDKLERCLLGLENAYTNVLPHLRLDASVGRLIASAGAKQHTMFARMKSGEGSWQLDELATSPHHRRKGVGRRLVEWGVCAARQEGVPVIVDATRAGLSLYETFGFRIIGFKEHDVEGLRSTFFMIIDSRGEWVREAGEEESWVQCKEDGWLKVDVVWKA